MGWFGKIIGGTFGFMLGGPLGLIAGAAFGHMYDASATQYGGAADRQGNPKINTQEQLQMAFFVAAFSMLAKIVAVDGEVTPAEQKKVDEFIDHDLRLRGESREAAGRIFKTAQHAQGTFDQFALQFYQIFRTNRQMLDLLIDIFYRVSYADGLLSQAEEALIQRAGRIFRLSQEYLAAVRSRYSAKGSSAGSYAVLGISSEAENDEVKKAYRKLVGEYHPDKIAAKGLPEEFTKFANDKFREIQSAYEEINKARGM
ncbi:MAG: co-chaperone DjlA [Spirochaetales bacterium]|jgi:DnaJ like chaperone protein|nr:co-chaperone DjlA [Spirochaetales bacterium]